MLLYSIDSPPDSSGFEFGVRGIVRLHSGYFILSWEFLLQSGGGKVFPSQVFLDSRARSERAKSRDKKKRNLKSLFVFHCPVLLSSLQSVVPRR